MLYNKSAEYLILSLIFKGNILFKEKKCLTFILKSKFFLYLYLKP